MDEIPAFETFGSRLLWWREKLGYTHQGKFSKLLGIQQGSLSELEKGKSKQPSAEVLMKASEILGLRPRYLLYGELPAEGLHITELAATEVQLVMLYRQLTEGGREGLLITLNDQVNRVKPSPAPHPTKPRKSPVAA